MSTEATQETFWSLLSEKKYIIYIPRIQRDYAQGRKDQQATQIRQKFIKDIFESLEKRKKLDINFVYGNVEEGQNGQRVFVPIDGQQRLTTLFLLYWYFASWSGNLNDANREILSRFQYETRFVSGEFCQRLVREVRVDLQQLNDLNSDTDLIDKIKDYYWFFNAYDNDATIKSMLVVLQDIHNTVKCIDDKSIFDTFFSLLSSKECPVTFLYLDIANLGLTDEIYIKMNARGKALTRYENFKAQLSSYLASKNKEFAEDFIKSLNGKWSRFFWNEEYRPVVTDSQNKETRTIVFDSQVLNLFRFIMWNEYLVNTDIDEKEKDGKMVRTMLDAIKSENEALFFNRLFIDEFRKTPKYCTDKSCVNEDAFYFVNKLLNALAKRKEEKKCLKFLDDNLYNKTFFDEESLFQRLIESKDPHLNNVEQVLLYAEFCFLVKYSDDDGSFCKDAELTDWIRVISNMANATLYNSVEDIYRSIRGIRRLIDNGYALNILDYLSSLCRRGYKQGSGFGFVDYQVMEECIKANLLKINSDWRKSVIDAEKSFLDNQIASILAFSGISDVYSSKMTEYEAQNAEDVRFKDGFAVLEQVVADDSYLRFFGDYLAKINLLFDKNRIKPELDDSSLLRRALLTYGGAECYMLQSSKTVYAFLDASHRDYGFKRLLRDDNCGRRKLFQNMLDDIDLNKSIAGQLEAIVSKASFDKNSEWKRYFVEMPELFSSDIYREPYKFIYRNDNGRILLLERKKTSSTNREYYSYVLHLKAKQLELPVKSYFTSYSEGTEKYVRFEDESGTEVQILYVVNYDNSQRNTFIARKNGKTILDGSMSDMLNYMKEHARQK